MQDSWSETREDEAKWHAFLKAAPNAIIIINQAGRIAVVNELAEQLFGYTREELIGQPIEMLVPERFRANHVRHRTGYFSDLHARPMGAGLNLYARRKDDSEFPVEISLSPVETSEGMFVTSIISDITKRKQAEQELQARLAEAKAAEAKWRTFLESAPNAIVIVNQEGRIAIVNAQTEQLFGYRREELLGQPIEMLIPERFRGAHLGHRTGYVSDPRARAMGAGLDLHARRKDGSEFPVEISLNPVPTSEGMLVTSIISDITKRKQAEETLRQTATELARSNKELEEFAYVASHDLQEPLRMVVSYLQLLKRRYQGKLDADADEFIAFAVDGANRMQTLIADLLSYSRVGTHGKAFARTDCAAALNRALANLRVAIEEHQAVVTQDSLPTVMADEVQLGQVFQNLIGNAIKFHGEAPPRVHVSARREGNHWLFSVRDNGIGLEPEYAERIFKVFQRLHGKTEYPGTGIGLAVCKKIVERHGGRIWVESELGQGATFYFTIPGIGGRQA